jgi:hypothetical protein
MKHLLTLACTTFALFCLCPETVGQPHQTKKKTADAAIWVLQQTHSDVGQQEIFIAPDAIKVINRRSGYELVCKAPSWEVHCLRRSEKLEWVGPLSAFDGLLLVNPNAYARMSRAVLYPRAKGKKLGLNYTRFARRASVSSFIDGTADITAAPSALEFICRMYRCANTQTLPLQITTYHGNRALPKIEMGTIGLDVGNDLRSGRLDEMTTQSWKRAPYKADIFALPLGFKRVTSLPQVSYSTDMKNQFDEMFRNGSGFRRELH